MEALRVYLTNNIGVKIHVYSSSPITQVNPSKVQKNLVKMIFGLKYEISLEAVRTLKSTGQIVWVKV